MDDVLYNAHQPASQSCTFQHWDILSYSFPLRPAMHNAIDSIPGNYPSLIQCLAISFARPRRNILSTSSPFASTAKPFLQSHPRFLSPSDFMSALLLLVSLLDSESSIELPTKEKLLLILLIVFLSSSRDDAGARRP